MESVREFYFDGPASNCFGYVFANTHQYIDADCFDHTDPDIHSDCFGYAPANRDHCSDRYTDSIGNSCAYASADFDEDACSVPDPGINRYKNADAPSDGYDPAPCHGYTIANGYSLQDPDEDAHTDSHSYAFAYAHACPPAPDRGDRYRFQNTLQDRITNVNPDVFPHAYEDLSSNPDLDANCDADCVFDTHQVPHSAFQHTDRFSHTYTNKGGNCPGNAFANVYSITDTHKNFRSYRLLHAYPEGDQDQHSDVTCHSYAFANTFQHLDIKADTVKHTYCLSYIFANSCSFNNSDVPADTDQDTGIRHRQGFLHQHPTG